MPAALDEQPRKLTQAEVLERLSPAPFNQKKCVPPDAKIQLSPQERWWRSDSPDREGRPDVTEKSPDLSMSMTRGVLGAGKRSGPSCYQTQYQTGAGTAAHFKVEDAPRSISGYSGHIAGKYAGNVIGGTYDKSNEGAMEHLKTTAQARRFGAVPLEQ